MNSRQFLAKQRVKYIWKSLRYTDSSITDTPISEIGEREVFWDFELIPHES